MLATRPFKTFRTPTAPTAATGGVTTNPILRSVFSTGSGLVTKLANPLMPTATQRSELARDVGMFAAGGIGGGIAGALDGWREAKRIEALAMWASKGGDMSATTEAGQNPWASPDLVAAFVANNPDFPSRDPAKLIGPVDLPLAGGVLFGLYGLSGLPGRDYARQLGAGMLAYYAGDLARSYAVRRSISA